MYAPASQFLNAFLVGATMAFAVIGTTPGGLFAFAEDKPVVEAPGGKIDARLPPTPEPAARSADLQPALIEAKTDVIVPPLLRKRPPAAPTSVPIVAAPEKAVKPSPAPPAKTKVKAADKAAPAPKDLKCAAGFKYDTKSLKCAKVEPAKAASNAAPAPATPQQPRTK